AHCLFHSLQEIAAEKAGIIKPGVPVIVAEQRDEARRVILAKAHDQSAPIIETNSAFCIESAQMMNGFVRTEIQEIATHKHFEVAPHLAGRFHLAEYFSRYFRCAAGVNCRPSCFAIQDYSGLCTSTGRRIG